MPLKESNSDRPVEAPGQPNGDKSKTTLKKVANKSNPSASTIAQQPSPHTSKKQNIKILRRPKDKPAVTAQAKSSPPKCIFHCQLAHGSPTREFQLQDKGIINVKEIYVKISECYQINVKEILFCTLNTYKVEMDKLLGPQLYLNDDIFAHVKGRRSKVKISRRKGDFGMTITENGAGLTFIYHIEEGSIIDKEADIDVGDHIESINGENVVGLRHYYLAQKLLDIPVDNRITLGLVKPFGALKLRFTS